MRKLSRQFWLCNCAILIVVFSVNTSLCQTSMESFADSILIRTQDSDFALKEYLRAYYFSNGDEDEQLLTKIANIYSAKGQYDKALQYLDMKYFGTNDIAVKNEALEGKVLIFIAKNQLNQALINAYQLNIIDSTSCNTKNFYVGFCMLLKKEYKTSLEQFKKLFYLDSSEFKIIEKIVANIEKIDKKNPNKAIFFSALLPGLGQTIYGDPVDGLKSFGLISGLTVLMFEISSKLTFADALLSVGPWITRYEIGGMANAKQTAVKYIRNKKNKEISNFLTSVHQAKVKS